MKKKIMIFMLLLSFLVGVGVPDQAKAANSTETTADDVKYRDIEDFMGSTGYSGFEMNETSYYFVFNNSSNGYYEVFEIPNSSNNEPFVVFNEYDSRIICVNAAASKITCFYYWNPVNAAEKGKTDLDRSKVYNRNIESAWFPSVTFNGSGILGFKFNNSNYTTENLVYCDVEIYGVNVSDSIYTRTSDNLLYEGNKLGPYDFMQWCSDAGLSCAASGNESSSVIPFWYEPDYYNYIVRKTLTASSTSGFYQMTMLQKSDGAHYPYYFEVNDIGYLGVAGAFADTSTFTIRNFYYDAEGNGWKLIEKFDVSTLPFDNTNVTFDENVVFIYSDTDIYADRAASSVWQPASTGYFNVDIPEPEITRVPVNPGTGSVGGQAKPGGIMEFVISTITLAWTDLFAVKVPVDGYQISFQQIFVYGALAAILWWLGSRIFGKK